jgi:histidine ammonia-lyase
LTGLVLAHNSLASAQRIIKLNDPHMTGLSHFLGTGQTVHAFGAMEKPPVALVFTLRCAARLRSLIATARWRRISGRQATLLHSYPG